MKGEGKGKRGRKMGAGRHGRAKERIKEACRIGAIAVDTRTTLSNYNRAS